jgi:hypothetical protein
LDPERLKDIEMDHVELLKLLAAEIDILKAAVVMPDGHVPQDIWRCDDGYQMMANTHTNCGAPLSSSATPSRPCRNAKHAIAMRPKKEIFSLGTRQTLSPT